jgi:PAS domain S-box-containing protein
MMAPAYQHWRIVIIEDSPDDRAALRRLLLEGSDRRFTFEEAVSGSAGVQAVHSAAGPPDCVLLDYNLPDTDALAVLRALAAPDGFPVCPVVVVTSSAIVEAGRALLRAGAQDFVGKSWITAAGLTRVMENAVERWAMGRELRDHAAALRLAVARDALRLTLVETIRELADPVAIKRHAAEMLGEHLAASRVFFVEVLPASQVLAKPGYASGVAHMPSPYRLDDFGAAYLPDLYAGRTVAIADIAADLRLTSVEKARYAVLHIVANLRVPLLKNGELVAILAVHQNTLRVWTAGEIALVAEVAERTWVAVERARAEGRAKVTERRLSQLISMMPSFTAVLHGPAHTFEIANDPYYALVGRGTEILGKPVLEALPELADQPFPTLLDRVYQTGKPFEAKGMEMRIARGPAGSVDGLYVDFVYQPMFAEDGSVYGILVHGVDRTVQVTAEKALRRRERELQALADNTPDILSRLDSAMRYVFVNAAIENATGLAKKDFLGKTPRELGFPEEICRLWEDAARSVFATANAQSIEFSFTTPPGKRQYVSRLVPEMGNDNLVEFVLIVTSDVTERMRFEQMLSDHDKRKDEFLATLAHELRNPLAPVRSGLEVLRLAPHPDMAERTMGMMERQLGQMVRLIDDLLDVSRITSGKVILRTERLPLYSVVATAVEAARPLIDAAGHRLDISLGSEPLWLDADPTRIAQVISNLLTNSAKYTRSGGHITLSAERQQNFAVIAVTDNGLGIPPEMMSTIFDMFTQVNRTLDRSQGGLGIGLALVKRLVEMHGGSISAESAGTDRGSTFTLRVPLAMSGAAVVAPRREASRAASGGGERILVVDDNADAAESLAMLLGLSGFETRTAVTGFGAIELASAFIPQIVFLDIGLPDIDGYAVARKIRTDPRLADTRLIALTGWGTEADQRKSKDAGFDAHLTKPVESASLNEVLVRFTSTSTA